LDLKVKKKKKINRSRRYTKFWGGEKEGGDIEIGCFLQGWKYREEGEKISFYYKKKRLAMNIWGIESEKKVNCCSTN